MSGIHWEYGWCSRRQVASPNTTGVPEVRILLFLLVIRDAVKVKFDVFFVNTQISFWNTDSVDTSAFFSISRISTIWVLILCRESPSSFAYSHYSIAGGGSNSRISIIWGRRRWFWLDPTMTEMTTSKEGYSLTKCLQNKFLALASPL